MKMNLYRVAPIPAPQFMIVAESADQAGQIFITYSAASGFFRFGKLIIERYDAVLSDELAEGLESVLDRGVPGVAKYTTGVGWSLIPPG